jgi:rhamnosyl/mannosyltransferase
VVRQRKLLRLYGPVQRRIIDRADRIVVATPHHFTSSEQLQRPGVEAKLHVVPYGIDFSRLDAAHADASATELLSRFAAGRPLLLTVGRHIYYKGYEHLIAALAKLRSDAVLVMVGTGPLSESLRLQAQELGVASRVLFMGEVGHGELVAAYHRCDVFTLPSIEPSEAFGIASAEAMACSKPTVVCELNNGVNHLNQDGRTGLTVPPRDVPALADALDRLLRDGAARQRMGAAADQWVRAEFSIENMRRLTLEMYRPLL